MSKSRYDIVHTITDWYDGARAGVADLNGKPHYYECPWDEANGDWSEVCHLSPIDDDTFRLAMEDWQIWRRWRTAFDEGRATIETHPALPEDRARHDELSRILTEKLVVDAGSHIKAKGDFKYGEPTLVRWSVAS
jgi:hypothetical protein